jgi:hypothetical protein
MSTPQTTLAVELDAIARLLKRQLFEQALQRLQGLIQAGIRQELPLVLQRYFSELAMECVELSGQHEAALQYVEQALANYAEKPPESEDARRDRQILMLRKAFLLVKLDRRTELAAHLAETTLMLSTEQRGKLDRLFRQLPRYSPAAQQRIVAEQQEIGLFHLSSMLMQQGASALQAGELS